MDSAVRRQTLADLLRRSAKRFPRKTAIVCGATRWTFAEFDQVTDRLAAGLARMGVAPGTRVAVLARNSHAFAALRSPAGPASTNWWTGARPRPRWTCTGATWHRSSTPAAPSPAPRARC